MIMSNIAEKIAYSVSQKGGRTFYVGGFVRDKIMGIENKDVDIEVHGIKPEILLDILSEVEEIDESYLPDISLYHEFI